MNDPEKSSDVKTQTKPSEPKKDVADKKGPDELNDDELDGVTGGQRCGGGHG